MLRRLMIMCFLAPDEAAAGGGSAEASTQPPTPESTPETQATAPSATFTQSDVDRIVKDRLDRERKAAADERKKADMTESEKLKAEKAELEDKVTEAEAKANKRMTVAEARLQSISAGVKPERIDALLKLADLSSVDIGEDGEPNAKQIKTAIEKALGEYPEFKVGASAKGGADYSGNGGQPALTEAAIMAMSPAEVSANMKQIEAYYKGRKAAT